MPAGGETLSASCFAFVVFVFAFRFALLSNADLDNIKLSTF